MITEVIKILRLKPYYGAGQCTEIAKGKHQLVNDWNGVKNKIKRQWQSRK